MVRDQPLLAGFVLFQPAGIWRSTTVARNSPKPLSTTVYPFSDPKLYNTCPSPLASNVLGGNARDHRMDHGETAAFEFQLAAVDVDFVDLFVPHAGRGVLSFASLCVPGTAGLRQK